MPFEPAKEKVWIGSLDETSLKVEAQYNPKELAVEKKVPWQKHPKPPSRSVRTWQQSS